VDEKCFIWDGKGPELRTSVNSVSDAVYFGFGVSSLPASSEKSDRLSMRFGSRWTSSVLLSPLFPLQYNYGVRVGQVRDPTIHTEHPV
jgi:hypothetical protein